MKVICRTLLALLALLVIPMRTWSQQQNSYILESPSLAVAQAACQKYGMALVSIIHSPDTFLVQISASAIRDHLRNGRRTTPLSNTLS